MALSRTKRTVLRLIAVLVASLVVVAGLFLAWCTATEYRPKDAQPLRVERAPAGSALHVPDPASPLTVVSFNIGYGGLGKGQDSRAHGGRGATPTAEDVDANVAGIVVAARAVPADVYLFQEVDMGSARSHGVDQAALLRATEPYNAAFAPNIRSVVTPLPWPPGGGITSGLLTMTTFRAPIATRVSLPGSSTWPGRLFAFKHCLLVERVPTADGKELVLVNVHLGAEDGGDGAIAGQTAALVTLLQAEYEAGNYVVAGGDFAQTFPGVEHPAVSDRWIPGALTGDTLPDGWAYANDAGVPTSRLSDRPWDGSNQLLGIDGFVLSPNVTAVEVNTIDLGFDHSDHNPVRLVVRLTSPDSPTPEVAGEAEAAE
jgi:endonuclease/exonuclease/phosphatase family metal-dependent hydrolase